jgi:predicted RNase H-like nuclease (RuvC/YqgF family)
MSYGLDEVLKLRPTEYFWKGKEQDEKSLGLIAQEVEQVISNVVTYNKEQDKYGVSYTELIPVLIKAIQEQNKTIETKELDIKNLKAQIKNFESRLGALEAGK